jgi:hypothetical protein
MMELEMFAHVDWSAPYTNPMTRAPAAILRSLPKRAAEFIEPMECLAVAKLPEGVEWVWEFYVVDHIRFCGVRRYVAVELGTSY